MVKTDNNETKNTNNTMSTIIENIEVTARAKAFSNEGIREHRFLVTPDDVKVWDDVAGHYTRVNALSESAKRRIRKIANEQ